MQRSVPEADWKTFRRVREAALEAFCQRVLEETRRFYDDDGRSHHDRYRSLFRWLRDRDRELADTFDDYRRSTMLTSLASMVNLGLVRADDLAEFSSSTREAVELLAGLSDRE